MLFRQHVQLSLIAIELCLPALLPSNLFSPIFMFPGVLFIIVAISFGGTFLAVTACFTATLCAFREWFCRKACKRGRESIEGNHRPESERIDETLFDSNAGPQLSNGRRLFRSQQRRLGKTTALPHLNLDWSTAIGDDEQAVEETAETPATFFGDLDGESDRAGLLSQNQCTWTVWTFPFSKF